MVGRMDHTDIPAVVDPKQVALKMKLDYSRGVKDHSVRSIEALNELLWEMESPGFELGRFLKEAAEMISRQFGIASVAICTRDPDGKYRYKTVVGLSAEATTGFNDIEYTAEQLLDPKTYPSYEISRHVRLYLGEDHPYADGEESSYQRPGLIGMKRHSLTESLEADYLDFFFYDPNEGLLGYVEASGTRLRKLPDSTTIIWLELVSAVIGIAILHSAFCAR